MTPASLLHRDWADSIARAIAEVPDEILVRAAALLRAADLVLTAGNGGSSAIASHAAQAIGKPDYRAGGGKSALCLTDGIPTLSAHANDGGWDSALAEAARPFLETFGKRATLLLISSSGKSENVVRLAKLGIEHGSPILAFTGFMGEPLRSLATIAIHVHSENYEIVEPAHDALLHRAQFHFREGTKS